MQVEKKHAFIMTNSGEFLKIRVGKGEPSLGEIYTGEAVKETPFFKYAATAASLAFILFFGGAAKAYYTPVSTVDISINPSVQLQLNRWDKIIKTTALNEDGKKVLEGLNIKNKALNEGLDLIVEEAKKDNFINKNYIESGKTIQVSISSKKEGKAFNLSEFEEYTKKNNLNVNISVPAVDTGSKDKNPNNKANGNSGKNATDKANENNNSTESDSNVDRNKSNPGNAGDKNNNDKKNNDKKNGELKPTSQNVDTTSNSQEKKSNPNSSKDIEKKTSEDKGKNKK